MDDLARQLFDTGVAMNRANTELLRVAEQQRRIVYLLWKKTTETQDNETLLGVCGTKIRADKEALDLGHGLGTIIRIEAREVHS